MNSIGLEDVGSATTNGASIRAEVLIKYDTFLPSVIYVPLILNVDLVSTSHCHAMFLASTCFDNIKLRIGTGGPRGPLKVHPSAWSQNVQISSKIENSDASAKPDFIQISV